MACLQFLRRRLAVRLVYVSFFPFGLPRSSHSRIERPQAIRRIHRTSSSEPVAIEGASNLGLRASAMTSTISSARLCRRTRSAAGSHTAYVMMIFGVLGVLDHPHRLHDRLHTSSSYRDRGDVLAVFTLTSLGSLAAFIAYGAVHVEAAVRTSRGSRVLSFLSLGGVFRVLFYPFGTGAGAPI